MSQLPTIVLLHGLFGARRILWRDYFKGVKKLYHDAGFRVIIPQVPAVGSIKSQAFCLEKALANEATPLHLVAHSMGGVYARYYITHLDGYKKVHSLTSLVSPHRGSAAADYLSENFYPARSLKGLCALTIKNMTAFNQQTPDMPNVYYRSYSAARPLEEAPWFVSKFAHIIQTVEGDNDTQVSIHSAIWGEHVRTLHADHLEIIGLNAWMNPFKKRTAFKHLPLYQEIGDWINATFPFQRENCPPPSKSKR